MNSKNKECKENEKQNQLEEVETTSELNKNNNSIQTEKKYTIKELNEKLEKEIESEPNNPKHYFAMVSLMKLICNWKSALQSINKCVELDPKNPEYILLKGDFHEKLQEIEEATNCYLKALMFEPDHRGAYYRLAKIEKDKGRYEECIKYVDKILAIIPKKTTENTSSHFIESENKETEGNKDEADEEDDLNIDSFAYELKGIALKRLGDIPGALAAYEKSIHLNPKNYNVYYNKGILHQDKGEFVIAKELYKKANECQEIFNNNAYVNLGAIHQSEGNIPESIICFEAAVKINQQDSEIIFSLGLIYESLSKWEECLMHLYQLTKFQNPFSHSPELFAIIGKCLKFLDRHPEAFEAFDRALKLDSFNEIASAGKANLLCLQNEFDQALELCDSVLVKKPESRELLFNRATALQGLNLFDQSLCAFDILIKLITPKSQEGDLIAKQYLSDSYSGKAANLMNLNSKEEALQVLENALELNSDNASALWNKAVCLMDLKKSEEAIKIFEAYDKIKPGDYKTLNSIASLLINIDKNADALKNIEKSIEINDKISQSFYYKGVALHNMSDFEDAVEAYDHALVLDPKNENTKKMKKMIWEELRKLTKRED